MEQIVSQLSEGFKPATTWVLDFQSLGLGDNKFCCLSHSVCDILLQEP